MIRCDAWNGRVNKGKNTAYVKSCISLDIETTSLYIKDNKIIGFDKRKKGDYYKDLNKIGIMYIWMVAIDDDVFYGRTWEELKDFIFKMNSLYDDRKIVIYIQNLSYEFQFLRNIFEFEDVFARKTREVLRAKIKGTNIELRCSYALSGMSLDEMAKNYNLGIEKKTGDLDYLKIRNSKTELTEDELEYCKNDVLIINKYIKYMLKKYGSYKRIPMTKTGEIRQEFKQYIVKNYEKHNEAYAVRDWKAYVAKMTPCPKQFRMLVKCFAGGYVHGNAYYINKLVRNVKSYDLTSSYIYTMLSERLPMGRFWNDTVDINNLDEEKAYMFTLRFYNLRARGLMTYISTHKIDWKESRGILSDNGRIRSGRIIEVTITDIDYKIIKDLYTYDNVEVIECKSARKDYIPKVFYTFIVKIYKEKAIIKEKLKRGEATEAEYTHIKGLLNSLYGMCITNYITDKITYENEWNEEEITDKEIDTKLNDMFKNPYLLLPYQWGVWIAAASRRNVWEAAYEVGNDVIYIDTDSVKYINKHEDVFERYNERVDAKLKNACKIYDVDFEDIRGLGHFEYEGNSTKFKTLGAKKYAQVKNGEFQITIAGVNKKAGAEYMKTIENFKPGFIFNYDGASKNIKYYNDEQPKIEVKDYQGNIETVNQKYGICLQPTTYELNFSEDIEEKIEKNYTHSTILNNL